MTTPALRLLRRLLVVLLPTGTVLSLAPAARADVPVGFSDPGGVNALHAVLLLAGVPLLLFVVIATLVYLPSLIRGERVAPGAPEIENQWLGGPRTSTGELTAPGAAEADPDSGGASGRW